MGTIVYKYRAINDNTKDSLRNAYFYFSQPHQLNDVYDAFIPSDYYATKKEIQEWSKKKHLSINQINKLLNDSHSGELEKIIEKEKEKLRERYFILCLSMVWNETMMWAYYAESNSGLCIGYNTKYVKNTYMLEVDMKNDPKEEFSKDEDEYLLPLIEIKYEKKSIPKYNPFKRNYEAIKNGFFYKEPKWSMEKEVRAFFINETKENRIISAKDHFVYYPRKCMKEITFGIKAKKN